MGEFHQKPVTFVREVSINVMHLDNAIRFYQDIIGLQLLKKTDRKAVLTTDGKTPLLTLEQPADVIPKEGRTTGLYHFALLLPTRADLSIFLRHLLQTEYRFGASDHDVSEALYITDPDGNGIEVYWDRPSSDWKWSNGEVAMGTDPLDGNSLLAESDAEWNGLPAGTLMGHIHLHVADLRKTEEFYMLGLGFTIVNRFGGALFTSTGGYHHHIGLNTWNGVGAPAPKKNSVGLNWYSLVFADEEARNKVIEKLNKIGAEATKEDGFYVITDPSGNEIHLVI
ncbi:MULTISPECIES: VOC family protein [Peribacillus]|uniref:VOC family protein n=1 Tax=Peribacillus butanolivorans TaxID=421767 RepID=A0ABN5NAQ9_9BACI|nr:MULTISPECIES: VOC family protein [Peribacillus]AXN41674.1 VOC family protein [Peribacillus butanolivorans]MBK5443128.1 VOC family protein [Peribacillus sp. TH24]MBK5462130.1 VOC family protein [Peribacillus sp. TH27]MBK5500285.1 VOC family protein [Peribacillus sp. TH14]WMX54681.1 VOC family protein [Peribacillus sp. R9-11]